MPHQAILDLPIIEFEAFRDSPSSLHAHCIQHYGISGLAPHADAVFHLGASLWRYRESESPKQVSGLAACYLVALSDLVSARRRLDAARKSTRSLKRIRDAEITHEDAAHHLAEVTRVLIDFVADMIEATSLEPARARRRLESNIEAMGERDWTAELERAAQGFVEGKPRVRWTDTLIDVLDALEAAPLPTRAANGRSRNTEVEERVLRRLEDELDEYRRLANSASLRLQQVDSERRELEQELTQTRSAYSHRTLELQEARNALEESLLQARSRLERLESDVGPQLRDELRQARQERDRLADELLQALSSATDSEAAREELLEQIELAAVDRTQAADAIGSLSSRLDAVQKDAETTAERAEAYRQRMGELEDDRNALRAELAEVSRRLDQSRATITALERAQGHSVETEQQLKEALAAVADHDKLLAQAADRQAAITAELEDTLAELERTRDQLARLGNEHGVLATRLAEIESVAAQRQRNLATIEGERTEMRAQLEQAQKEKARAEKSVDDVRGELDALRESRSLLAQQLQALEGKAAEATRKLTMREKDTGRLESELEATQKRVAELQDALARAQQAAGDHQGKQAALANLETELADARSRVAELGAEAEVARQETLELREQLAAANDLTAERKRNAEEKLSLLNERLQRLEAENRQLGDMLSRHEKARTDEKRELEEVIARAGSDTGSLREKVNGAAQEHRRLQDALKEAESFLITRQREAERAAQRSDFFVSQIAAMADLRAKYEATADEDARAAIASQISRKLDNLFAEAGRPVHADRKTEKILILHVKKDASELNDAETEDVVAAPRRRKAKGGSASGARDE